MIRTSCIVAPPGARNTAAAVFSSTAAVFFCGDALLTRARGKWRTATRRLRARGRECGSCLPLSDQRVRGALKARNLPEQSTLARGGGQLAALAALPGAAEVMPAAHVRPVHRTAYAAFHLAGARI